MEFQRERVYTALNADELKQGDKVIVAYNLYGLKEQVKMFTESAIDVIEVIQDEDYFNRFKVKHGESFPLAYLVERKENCTKCKKNHNLYGGCEHLEILAPLDVDKRTLGCSEYVPVDADEYKEWMKTKTEQKAEKKEMCLNCKHYNKVNDFRDCTLVDNPTGACPHYEAEKHYRPFRDTDELIKVWDAKIGTPNWGTNGDLTMPHIWVRHKATKRTDLIVALTYTSYATVYAEGNLENLFNIYEFLDGSPCGVEE